MKNPSQIARDFLTHGRSPTCPVIDMHGHYGPYAGIYFPRPYADGMLASMDRAGVLAIAFSGHAALVDPARGNPEVAAVVRAHPGRFYGYWAVDPLDRKLVEQEVARLPREPGFVGFKFHPDWHTYPITGADYAPALEYAHEHRLLVLSHSWGGSAYSRPGLFAEVARKYPQVQFLMGHAGYGEWDTAIAVAKEHGNVYLELTAASGVGGIVERFVTEAGAHKVLFGTDLPWFDPLYAIGCICFSRITDDDRRDILHRNAERLLAPFRPPEPTSG